MTQFIFTTLNEDSTSYTTPKGNSYVFYKNKPTRIADSEDTAFFSKNHRFHKAGNNARHEAQPDDEEEFKKELQTIKGIGKSIISRLLDIFHNKRELAHHLDTGVELQVEGLNKKQTELLIKKFAKRTQ